jgi:hypothetical protein
MDQRNFVKGNSGIHKFPNVYEPPLSSRRQNVDIKQVTYWGPKIIMRHRTKFIRTDDLPPGIRETLG